MREPLKCPGKLQHRGTDPKEDHRQTSEEGIHKILSKRGKGMERSKSYGSRSWQTDDGFRWDSGRFPWG